jgi:hypothetical protein
VNEQLITRRVEQLKNRFISFKLEVNRDFVDTDVLTLSKADKQFFYDLIGNHNPSPARDSHTKLVDARKALLVAVKGLMTGTTLSDKVDDLGVFNDLIDGDLSLLHIITYNKVEAYTLFRVLNDRGKSLTDGDLLKARVLELLESFPAQQNTAENLWNAILADAPSTTEQYLKFIYISYVGRRASTNNLVDDFMSAFYASGVPAIAGGTALADADANKLISITQAINEDIAYCRQFMAGEWPFTRRLPVQAWDATRLNVLVNDLNVTVVIPLLLAAVKLKEKDFSAIVQMLERFMFRFKVIGGKEIGPLNTILYAQSVAIRSNPATYSVSTLETALHNLQQASVSDATFKTLLGTLEYKPNGGNQPLKYFLTTLEYYRRWYKGGATGAPECLDRSLTYDFTTSTLEHIYPKNTPAASQDTNVEPLKNSLGNLTIMGPTDNVAGGNDDFATKKPIFSDSSVKMNNEIGANTQWGAAEINARADELKQMACAVFNI